MSSLEKIEVNVCRLCTKSVEDSDGHLNLFDKCNKFFLQQIKELTGLTIRDMPKQMLPRYFCTKCKEDLPRACNFRSLIIESQNYFKSKEYKKSLDYLNETSKNKCASQTFDTVFLYCKSTEDDKPNEDTKQNFSYDFSWCPDNTPAECVETLIEDIKNENFDIEMNEQSENLELSTETPSVEKDVLKTNLNASILEEDKPANEVKLVIKTEKTSQEKVLKEIKPKYKETKEKKPKNKTPKERKVKEKKPKEKKPKMFDPQKSLSQFVCDKCGASFQSRPGLVAHLLRHTGERKFGCEICEVKFFSIYELQRHTRFHTGESPYQCRHCERCFRDYSHRQRHERSKHLNIRPFACTTCGKAFTNNYIAKNHMLTHTKLRQFECKICDKYFLRQTHLITHFRSVTHKNNAAKFDKCGENAQNQGETAEWSSKVMVQVFNLPEANSTTSTEQK